MQPQTAHSRERRLCLRFRCAGLRLIQFRAFRIRLSSLTEFEPVPTAIRDVFEAETRSPSPRWSLPISKRVTPPTSQKFLQDPFQRKGQPFTKPPTLQQSRKWPLSVL